MNQQPDQGWVFEQRQDVADGVWERFVIRDGSGEERFLDIKVRPRYRHDMERIARKHTKESVQGRVRIREIPPGKHSIEFGKDLADYLIADWGGHGDDAHPYGPPGRFSRDGGRLMNIDDAAHCGIANEPDPTVPSDVRTWPLERNFKYLLLRLSPELDDEITEFARRIGTSIEGTEKEESEAEENLEPSPSSEAETPSSIATVAS